MKTWLILLSFLTAFSVTRAASDDDLKQACAQRLQATYGLTLAPSAFSLPALTEIEARLTLCFRLMKKTGRLYDYRTTSLTFLKDLEYRFDTCERIKANYNVLLRHEYYTATALADLENRVMIASRIYQNYGQDANWRTSSLDQLLTTESQLAAARTPFAKPYAQPLAKSALVLASASAVPRGETVTSSMSDFSYSSDTSTPSSFGRSSFQPARPVGTSSRRVTSSPRFYSTYDNSVYGSGYNYTPRYNSYNGYTPYVAPIITIYQ